ncbi:hypothetical protein E2320_021139 [Naja naja]|nr:hypothetical protein E2320_021139 [Naja naja]
MAVEALEKVVHKSATAIKSFYVSKDGHYILSALKLFEAKAKAQLLYETQVGPYTNQLQLREYNPNAED